VAVNYQSNDWITITGTNSIWDAGGSNLTVGTSIVGNSDNAVLINNSGTLDAIGTLTLAGALNYVNLRGGTLGVANTTYTNGLFTAGDGIQAATLKSLAGGTLTFTNGLLMTNNATLTGAGTVSGGATGVILTNGASLAPGLSGIGTLTIGGSNLTWNAGATYIVGISNFAGNAGVAYDTLNVSSQLTLVANAGSSSLVIRVSSMGTLAANFSANASYNLLVASNAVLTGFDPTKFTVNTNDFLNPTAGSWAVMTLNNNLYVTYRPTVEASLSNTWAAPTNGNWTVDGNWVGGLAPSVSSPGMRLTFGGSASDPSYVATNNNSGQFQINRLILTNANATATNLLAGNPLQFWNPDAAIEQWGGGAFRISNSLSLTTNLILRGTGTGTVLVGSNIVGVGALSHLGAATFVLLGSNTFSGPVLMNGLGGTLTMSNVWAFGTNSITVSNGTLCANPGSLTISALTTPRSVQVTGSNSVWTNASALTIGTNVQFTVDTGARLTINGALTVADRGTVVNSLMVTNGGQLFSTAASYIGNANSNNSMLVSGGGASGTVAVRP